MADKGKNFESLIDRWLTELKVYHHRFMDSRSMGRIGTSQPADYFVWFEGKLIYLELKDYSGTSLAFNSFSPSQWKSAIKGNSNNIIHIAVIRLNSVIYGINMQNLIDYIQSPDTTRKSFSIAFLEEFGLIITNKHELLSFLL